MPSSAFPPPRSPGPFTLDARSLALGRLLLAALLLLDLALRAGDLLAHYADAGVLPRGDFRPEAWDFLWSLHSLGGSASFEAALLALHALFAFAMLIGFRTFWATLAVALLSLTGFLAAKFILPEVYGHVESEEIDISLLHPAFPQD